MSWYGKRKESGEILYVTDFDTGESDLVEISEIEMDNYDNDNSIRGRGEEITEEQRIRNQRTGLLLQSDWAVGNDSPLSEADKTIWQTYRQKLRDLPEQPGFPNVAIPEAPDKQPFASWTYNTTTCVWDAPQPKPEGYAFWNETTGQWEQV